MMKKQWVMAAGMVLGASLLSGCQAPPAEINYRVVTMRYGTDPQAPLQSSCNRFRMSPAEAVMFFDSAKALPKSQWKRLGRRASCFYDGIMSVNGDMQRWMVTAAGVGYLVRGPGDRGNRYFLCTKECQRVFGRFFPVYTPN